MKKVKDFFKKYWFIISIIVLSAIRILWSYKLPSFYISGLNYDDKLMVDQLYDLLGGNYLGTFNEKTLIKGLLFPIVLFLIRLFKVSFSFGLTLLYILSSIFFIYSFKNIIKEKKYLIIVFIFILFNPVTSSQDLFQRLYRNSISITELLFFLGCVIRVLFSKDKKIYNYILFGLSLVFLFLTREDNLWTYPIILFIFIYNIIKERKIKNIIFNIIPIFILILSLNIVSFINYKNYGIYTYNEIQKSEFHNTYKKILQIKDDEKKEFVSIPKSTFYKLAENSKVFNMTKEDIDSFYKVYSGSDGEIYNGNIIWYFRYMNYYKNKFSSGYESEEYYKKLGEEIDKLFKNGTFEKELIMPSGFMAVPSKKQLLSLPLELLKTIGYTSTYKDIKTYTYVKGINYNNNIGAYYFAVPDYHYTVDIVKLNPVKFEMVRILYSSLTIVFSFFALYLYFRNIAKFDEINIFNHILVICYILIIGGVTYTHITSFHAVRPLYLGNIYLIQTIFILLNIYRLKDILEKNK